MKDLTYIKVKEGKLWASDYKKLEEYNLRLLKKDKNYGDYKFFSGKSDAEIKLEYDKDLEAFNQSFIEVGNPDFAFGVLYISDPQKAVKVGDLATGMQDGLYPVSGLQFEVRETEFGHVDDYSKPHGFKKFAILSLKQEQECESSDTGKHRWGEYIEGAPRCYFCGEAFFSSDKQEQPSEEKEEHFLKKHFLIGKQIRYHYVDWEVGSFTPWCSCNHSDLKKILEDNSIDIVEFKP